MRTCVFVFSRALKLLIPVTSMRDVNDSGMSPLHSAAAGGHTHCIKVCKCVFVCVKYTQLRRDERFELLSLPPISSFHYTTVSVTSI